MYSHLTGDSLQIFETLSHLLVQYLFIDIADG